MYCCWNHEKGGSDLEVTSRKHVINNKHIPIFGWKKGRNVEDLRLGEKLILKYLRP